MPSQTQRISSRSSSRRWLVTARLLALLLVATLIPPLTAAPTAAQSTGLPDQVLAASVRIMTNIVVTPDNGDEPFLCMLDRQTVLDYSVGSGTIITAEGHVLTNHHVVDNGRIPRIVRNYCEDQAPRGQGDADWLHLAWLPDERGFPTTPFIAEVIRDSSLSQDLALLQLVAHLDGTAPGEPFPFVEFGDSDDLREPEKITIIGYPANAGTNRRVSEGIFSGWGDNGYGEEWLYTDATISGGNSGGTAVNSQGLFIGIPTQATASDCRPGDTNNDGVIDEQDAGCVGIGGNYGILIPSNLARVFAEEALGITIPVVESGTPVDDDPTPEPETPVAADSPIVGEVEFFALDANEEVLPSFNNVTILQGCFENLTIQEGDPVVTSWYNDGELYYESEAVWDDAWNPEACASIWVNDGYLDAGSYVLVIEARGETVTSDPVVVTVSGAGLVESITFEARSTDGGRVTPNRSNVLNGEFDTLYTEIEFSGMVEDALWQVELYHEGDLIFTSDVEVWTQGEDGTETVRYRNSGRAPLEPGVYEIVVLVEDQEAGSATVEIVD